MWANNKCHNDFNCNLLSHFCKSLVKLELNCFLNSFCMSVHQNRTPPPINKWYSKPWCFENMDRWAIISWRLGSIELKQPPPANWNCKCQTHVIPARHLLPLDLVRNPSLILWPGLIGGTTVCFKGFVAARNNTKKALTLSGCPDEDQLITENG